MTALSNSDHDARITLVGDSVTRTDLVTNAIRTAILAGRLKPGTPLVERKIAEELNVSKTPVRESLIALQRNRLVEVTPTRVTVVRRLDLNDALEIHQVRLLLEPWAVGQTAETIEAHPTLIARAEALLDTADITPSGSTDRSQRVLANRTFHQLLYSGCGNSLVIQQLDEVKDLTAFAATSLLWENWHTWERESDEHRALLEYVRNGDKEGAIRQTQEHVASSMERIRTLIQQEAEDNDGT